jgi:hypothetical protein
VTVKTYYEMLEVSADAPVDEIKRAFRREIAKYHPDKVQHLGKEFQEIAASKAAELTLAYKTLTDPSGRADYDALLAEGGAPEAVTPTAAGRATPARPATQPAVEPKVYRPPTQGPAGAPGGGFTEERSATIELLRRATVARFRAALLGEFGSYQEVPVPGFEVTCIPKPPFLAFRLPPRVLGRFVPRVDGAALTESWSSAIKMKKDNQRDLCVFVMGPALASPSELATAISETRKRPMPAGGKLVMIPVSTKDWNALMPTDAPDVVKSLVKRLKSAS